MSLIKLASVDTTTFKVAGKCFLKGQYSIQYVEKDTDANGVITNYAESKVLLTPTVYNASDKSTLLPFKRARPYTDFLDSTGTAYASFDAFTIALSALISAPVNSAISDVIADKGTVTQGTSKTTAVVSNTSNTVITTFALTDAADTAFSFTFTNSKIAATSLVLPTVNMVAGTGKALITVVPGSGSAVVTVTNVSTVAFNAAIKIGLLIV